MGIETELLFEMQLDIPPAYQVGPAPTGARIIAPIVGGTVKGPKISGKVLNSGGDWMVVGADGTMIIDVRCAIEAEDGTVIYVTYGGRIAIPAEAAPEVFNPETVDAVDPSRYYFRSTPLFEVGLGTPHAWLNSVVAVGTGKFIKGGVKYTVYAVK
ncbi:DUF3237 domain-containing protein [Novosphingobium sp. KCTC 2891]|uniref:DUF3237 domain-containing protein n=1 Tax=Novosphingobium sp. KCTC 2891 TaxID=2989730 RepID=UPI0022223F61|nr:DUF3237 domain-containing protein [Novosphingobium sp. KCTC 2891]MCW1381642.1 DUF3237 domain-containing protein [Novosphingobium sp. KCTC 2891]